jgi:hypothetical protein
MDQHTSVFDRASALPRRHFLPTLNPLAMEIATAIFFPRVIWLLPVQNCAPQFVQLELATDLVELPAYQAFQITRSDLSTACSKLL